MGDGGNTGPVDSGTRLPELDALRGVALLGILLANVRQLFLPWEIGEFPVTLGGSESMAMLDWQFFHAFIDLKFITLFSLLFGIGFALQGERLTARGAGFASIYHRRILILAAFGVAHGLLLYPAEVLMPYAIGGLLLLAARNLSVDTLFRIGLVLLGSSIIWSYEIGSLGRAYIGLTALTVLLLTVAVWLLWHKSWRLTLGVCGIILLALSIALTLRHTGSPAGNGAAGEYLAAQQQMAALESDDPAAWPEEFRVRRAGDFAALVSLHARQYMDILFYFCILLLWRTLGLFMIGTALFRSGVFTRASPSTWTYVAWIGLGIGLPLSLLVTWLQGREMLGLSDWRFPEFLHTFSAFPLAAGIAGGVFVWQRGCRLAWLSTRFRAAGRMALSNYIGQSLVMAALAEPWGLNWYGRLDGASLTALALLVFAVLAQLSHAWLGRFRMGPLEWLWRCGTYWQLLPNRIRTNT